MKMYTSRSSTEITLKGNWIISGQEIIDSNPLLLKVAELFEHDKKLISVTLNFEGESGPHGIICAGPQK